MTIREYDPSRVVEIITKYFFKNGDRGNYTAPFCDFPVDVREPVLRNLNLEPDELPIVASIQDAENWSVLTTLHLSIRSDGTTRRIKWLDLQDFVVDFDKVKLEPSPTEVLDTITVLLRSGDAITIRTDPGRPFMAFWNCLIMAERMAPEEDRRRARSRE